MGPVISKKHPVIPPLLKSDADKVGRTLGSHTFGLNNPGNQCYKNAVLQMLTHMPEFVSGILQLSNQYVPIPALKTLFVNISKPVPSTLLSIFARMFSTTPTQYDPETCELGERDLTQRLGCVALVGNQQDAVELLNKCIFGKLIFIYESHYTDSSFTDKSILKILLEQCMITMYRKYFSEETCADMNAVSGAQKQERIYLLPIPMIADDIQRCITPPCEPLELEYEPERDAAGKPIRVSGGKIKYTTTRVRLSNGTPKPALPDYPTATHTKNPIIQSAGLYFIVSLIRFKGTNKNKKTIYINNSLKIGINNSDYILEGIIVHIGSTTNSGHYIYLWKVNDTIWRYFSDSSVYDISGVSLHPNGYIIIPGLDRSEDINTNGYIFLYKRVQPAALANIDEILFIEKIPSFENLVAAPSTPIEQTIKIEGFKIFKKAPFFSQYNRFSYYINSTKPSMILASKVEYNSKQIYFIYQRILNIPSEPILFRPHMVYVTNPRDTVNFHGLLRVYNYTTKTYIEKNIHVYYHDNTFSPQVPEIPLDLRLGINKYYVQFVPESKVYPIIEGLFIIELVDPDIDADTKVTELPELTTFGDLSSDPDATTVLPSSSATTRTPSSSSSSATTRTPSSSSSTPATTRTPSSSSSTPATTRTPSSSSSSSATITTSGTVVPYPSSTFTIKGPDGTSQPLKIYDNQFITLTTEGVPPEETVTWTSSDLRLRVDRYGIVYIGDDSVTTETPVTITASISGASATFDMIIMPSSTPTSTVATSSSKLIPGKTLFEYSELCKSPAKETIAFTDTIYTYTRKSQISMQNRIKPTELYGDKGFYNVNNTIVLEQPSKDRVHVLKILLNRLVDTALPITDKSMTPILIKNVPTNILASGITIASAPFISKINMDPALTAEDIYESIYDDLVAELGKPSVPIYTYIGGARFNRTRRRRQRQ